ncbi:MAG: hypothetical protein H6510_00310 [Acidobacteria bacterium]|nr:hypothetical protein [Acidobacteriota bacterium]MCB9396230.1 hypothetical protein [Acidobacteriota bacterium]
MSPFQQLQQLLAQKVTLLELLVNRQADLRDFLVRPRWSRYFELVQPLEHTLNALQQAQEDEQHLLRLLAKLYRRPVFHNLGSLIPFLNENEKTELASWVGAIRKLMDQVQKTQHLLHQLHVAHAQFISSYVHGIQQSPTATCYNARGQSVLGDTPTQLRFHI